MPGVGIDDFGANIIKYLPGVRYTMRLMSPLRKIPLRNIKWEGEKLVQKLHVGENMSVSMPEDGGPIPAADKQDYVEMEVARKNLVGSVQITDGQMANAKGKGTVIPVVKSELGGMIKTMSKVEGHLMAQDGTGQIATLGSTVSGATITVDDARMMWPKMNFEIRDATTTSTVHVSGKVASVARAYTSGAATVTLDSSIAANGQAQGDLVVWQNGDYSGFGRCITGLDALIDDTASGTFQGVAMTSYPWWTSPVFNGGGSTQNLTTNLMRTVFATLKQESENFDDQGGLLVLTEAWSAVNFEELFENALRTRVSDTKVGIPGGLTFQTAFGTVTVKAYPEIKYGNMLFINRSAIARPVQRELDWRPGGVSGVFQRSDSFLGFTATALEICDLMIFERNTCAKITNLAVSPQTAY